MSRALVECTSPIRPRFEDDAVGLRTVGSPLLWLAARVETASADGVELTLPGCRLTGVLTTLAPVHFKAATVLGIALLNG